MYQLNTKNDIIMLRNNYPKHWVSILKRHNIILFEQAKKYCQINNILYKSNSQMLYHWCNNITKIPICPITNISLNFMNNKWCYRKLGKKGLWTDDMLLKRSNTRKLKKSNYSIKNEISHIKSSNYEILTKDDIINKLKQYISNKTINMGGIIANLVKNDKQLIFNCLKYQKDNNLKTLMEAIYCLYNTTTPYICPITNKPTTFINFKQGYTKYHVDKKDYELIKTKRNISIQNKIDKISKKTEQNLTNKDIFDIVKNVIDNKFEEIKSNPFQYFQLTHPNVINHINNITNYLDKDCKFTERLYHIYHKLSYIPLNYFKSPAKFETFEKGYRLCENAYTCSIPEIQIREYISSIYKDNIIYNDRKILKNKNELDIYLPNINIAFEIHGEYYHSTAFKNKNYHLDKLNICKKNNIKLYQIWVSEWLNKNDIVKSKLNNILNYNQNVIYGRKCIVKEISPNDKSEFLTKYHLQGNDNSQYYIGSYYNNELISVMTFGKRQISKYAKFELIRYCCKSNYKILGIASKMFSYFISKYQNVNNIISYADLRWSNGELYPKLGFKFLHQSKPNYWYFKNNTLYHRVNFQKHKLKQKLQIYSENKTEKQNMIDNGYYMVWDCGNLVYEWTR